MTGHLAAYLRRRIGGATLGVWLLLAALVQVLELLDATSDILARHLGIAGLLRYAWLRAPEELLLVVPLAALIGPLFGFYALARSQEAVAVRAGGISLRRVVLWLLPVAFVVAGLQFALADWVVPRTQAAMTQWWSATQPPQPGISSGTPQWLHTDAGLVSIDQTSADARHLTGVHIFHRNGDGLLVSRTDAQAARWTGQGWLLSDACTVTGRDTALEKNCQKQESWNTDMRPDDLLRLGEAQPHLSGTALVDVIRGQRAGSHPLSYYRMALVQLFTKPLAVFVMLLLAVPVVHSVQRGGGGGGALVVALALGLVYVLVDGLLGVVGAAGRISPLVAGFLPLVVFGMIGLAGLARADTV